MLNKLGLILALVTAVASAACANATSTTDTDTPDLEDDGLLVQDEGTSWNGWTMSLSGFVSAGGFPVNTWYSSGTFTRTSGDATRGGGSCNVWKRTANPSSCTSDADCIGPAQAQFGSQAYGYCYAGSCYDRQQSQANGCSVNPNRAPSSWNAPTQIVAVPPDHKTFPGACFALGCMTKTGGPNTACGGSNTSLYMRAVVPFGY
jgi:hypothetical protein